MLDRYIQIKLIYFKLKEIYDLDAGETMSMLESNKDYFYKILERGYDGNL